MLVLNPDAVKNHRLSRAWTQQRLAAQADLTVMTVSRIERGLTQPKVSTILRLADALGVEPSSISAVA